MSPHHLQTTIHPIDSPFSVPPLGNLVCIPLTDYSQLRNISPGNIFHLVIIHPVISKVRTPTAAHSPTTGYYPLRPPGLLFSPRPAFDICQSTMAIRSREVKAIVRLRHHMKSRYYVNLSHCGGPVEESWRGSIFGGVASFGNVSRGLASDGTQLVIGVKPRLQTVLAFYSMYSILPSSKLGMNSIG